MRILVVEDDHDVRIGLEQILSENAFLVDIVDNGSEGLYRALNWEYDAVILDVMLPEMDGWKILQKLRENKATPVIMLTALGQTNNRIRGLDHGADDYLCKPFDSGELLARLRALIRRSAGHANNRIEIGRVSIDTTSKEVYLDGEPVVLTGAQYRILYYLGKRAGKVVTKAEICDALDRDDTEQFSNVLEVQIHHIRKKLGKDVVENRRGLGYVMPIH